MKNHKRKDLLLNEAQKGFSDFEDVARSQRMHQMKKIIN